MDVVNVHHDTPAYSARKAGCPLLMQKAVDQEVKCPGCHKKEQLEQWEEEHRPSAVERSISTARSSAFPSP